MRQIVKIEENEPLSLKNWKAQRSEKTQADIEDNDCKGRDMWKSFTSNTERSQKLRAFLIKEQGYICCFCGQGIHAEYAETEHFYPKGIEKDEEKQLIAEGLAVWESELKKRKSLVYEYSNLFASCKGGATANMHTVKKDSTLRLLAEEHRTKIADILANNADWSFGKSEKKLSDFKENEPLPTGTKLTIMKKPSQGNQHCNNKKSGEKLSILDLTLDKLEEQFVYSSANGKMKASASSENPNLLQADIDNVLGLNTPRLQEIRENIAKTIEDFINYIKEEVNLDAEEEISKEISRYDSLSEGKFIPFCFVYVYQLKTHLAIS